jgi:hypothetical protein
MKLTCSKRDHISDQPINWFTGKHHEYVCEQCGVLLQCDLNATVSGDFINILGVDVCQHRGKERRVGSYFSHHRGVRKGAVVRKERAGQLM